MINDVGLSSLRDCHGSHKTAALAMTIHLRQFIANADYRKPERLDSVEKGLTLCAAVLLVLSERPSPIGEGEKRHCFN